MGDAVGDILPLALGVAISPMPIIAVVLMLFTPRAGATSMAFLAGWVLGVLLPVVFVTAVTGVAGADQGEEPATAVSWIKIVLAVLFLMLAVHQWRSRPRPGNQVEPPGWMRAIDTTTAPRAAGLGFALSALNPKNLAMAIGAGVAIGGAALAGGEQVIAVSVFVVLAVSTVAVPVLGYAVAADRMRGPLDTLRSWLAVHNAAVLTVVLAVIGVAVLGQGLRGAL